MPYPFLRPIAGRFRAVQTPVLHRFVVRPSSRPMRLPQGAAVVIAPHADDETFGCGGLIALKRAAGIHVSVVVITDGSQSDSQVPIDRSALVQQRKRELISAGSILGVPAECVHFLGAPDGDLATLPPARSLELCQRLRELIAQCGAQEVYVPHRHDRHSDHEATHRLTLKALTLPGWPELPENLAVFEYLVWLVWKRPVWPFSLADLRGAGRLDVAAVQGLKNQAIASYHSQLATMPAGFLPQFQRGEEYYWARSMESPRRELECVQASAWEDT